MELVEWSLSFNKQNGIASANFRAKYSEILPAKFVEGADYDESSRLFVRILGLYSG